VTPPRTPLEAHLRRRIAADGPLTIADFMADALGHPDHGYYMTRDPFGRAGDFTTAPEISQMFGELIGLWCAEVWRSMGAPVPVRLVELGPGRGTLMSDLLRAGERMPGFLAAISVHLVETSPVLRAAQERTLGARPTWHDTFSDVPDDAPMLLIANEFFDALPIRQITRTEAGWRERLLGITPEDDRLAIGLAAAEGPLESLLDADLRESARPGQTAELAPVAWRIAGEIGARLASRGGAALIVDYGHAGPALGNTLQAVRNHEPCDVLETPGEADLTAHVDFTPLAKAAEQSGARATPLSTQGAFLRALGIGYRARTLAAAGDATAVERQVARLIGDDAMGTLFKVLGLAGPETPPLPGLEET
jgi:NADH dehydrogenase [ubiquinone] 1 alpha subcomplex assembly factor 7